MSDKQQSVAGIRARALQAIEFTASEDDGTLAEQLNDWFSTGGDKYIAQIEAMAEDRILIFYSKG